jgi:hypothetical protein
MKSFPISNETNLKHVNIVANEHMFIGATAVYSTLEHFIRHFNVVPNMCLLRGILLHPLTNACFVWVLWWGFQRAVYETAFFHGLVIATIYAFEHVSNVANSYLALNTHVFPVNGDTYILHTLYPRRGSRDTLLFLRVTHVLPILVSYEEHCRRDRW